MAKTLKEKERVIWKRTWIALAVTILGFIFTGPIIGVPAGIWFYYEMFKAQDKRTENDMNEK